MKLTLFTPVKPLHINQGFGSNSIPLYGNQGFKGHPGIDLFAKHGQPVYASHDGLASFQIDAGGGHGVVIITDKEYDYGDSTAFYKTIYWHLADGLKEPQYESPIADKTGFIKVKAGDLIGYADNTGASTGDHLHFGLKPVAKGESWGTWDNVEQNNGYHGAIDPTPFTTQIFAEDLKNFKFTKTLKFGSHNDEVKVLQYKLGIKVDGIFGLQTEGAVKQFQIDNHLTVDGIVGRVTNSFLNK